MGGERTHDDGRDRAEQEPLRRGVVDGSLPDVVQSPLPMPNTSVRRPAPIAWAGYSPTTKKKNGLKNSAPEAPEASTIIEKRIEAGNTHQ